MPFVFNPSSKSIIMACGDTANIGVNINYDKLVDGDVILFAIFDRMNGDDLLCKTVEVKDGKAEIRLCNHDTRDIAPGEQNWNLRIVTNPAKNIDGSVYVDDCLDDVITVFNIIPTIKLIRGGAYV